MLANNNDKAPKGTNKVGIIALLSRGILAGIAIFISVLISNTNGIAAGMASTFPGICFIVV
jgi:hypothetical protein